MGTVPQFVALLRACAKNKDLQRGKRVHSDVGRAGLLRECADALIAMYAKCGALEPAQELFDCHQNLNVVTWTSLIAGYAQNGQGHHALYYFECMQQKGLALDSVTFSCALKACSCIKAFEKGANIHNEIAKKGFLPKYPALGNALINMYAKCGALARARQVLEELPVRNVISWTTLIEGYVKKGQGKQALACFEQMQQDGLSPNAVTYICLLKACGRIGAYDKGEEIHDEIEKQGLLRDNAMLGTALVDMYSKCGALEKGRQVLKGLSCQDVSAWTALIAGYAEHGQGEQALECFHSMKDEGLSPNVVTFICLLKACGSIRATDKGDEVCDEIIELGLLRSNVVLGNALVDMYAKCGALAKARQVLEALPLRNVVSWTGLIAGYAEYGEGEQALDCYLQMQREGLFPNAATFACLLKACGSIGAADKGEEIHNELCKQCLLGYDSVLGNALVDMYAKCGALSKARRVLEELPMRDVISWTALIAAYAENGEGEEALSCLELMQCEGLSPNVVTLVFILKACGCIGAVDKGAKLHEEIAKQGLLGDVLLGNALVEMYAKSGALTKARQALTELPAGNVIAWTVLIAGYAEHGECDQALECFKEMECDGLSPDAATLSCVLSACSHLGLVEDAELYFTHMSTNYGLKPDIDHYTCMVDLFGRAGLLDQAVAMVKKMPSSNCVVWSALLGACQKWGEVEVGRWAFECAIQVDKSDAGFYTLMANIYAAVGMQEDAERVESMRIANKAWKKRMQSCWVPKCGDALCMDAQSKDMHVELQGFTRVLITGTTFTKFAVGGLRQSQ